MRVECAHGDGNTEGSRATRRDVDTAGLAGERRESSVLSALEPTAGGMPLRRVRGGAVPAVLCGEAGASQLGAGGVLPAAADRVFRRDRFGAWDRLAGAGIAGAAALSAGRTGGVAAGSFHDLADAAVDGCGDAPGSVHLGAGGAGGERTAEGKTLGIDATTLEANAALRTIVRRDTGEGYQEFLKRLAQESGIATPTREQLARLDRKRAHKGSNEEWEHPHDPDARITKMKDGRTHLAHKVEQAVDFSSGAVVAVTLQPADRGDTRTVGETVCEAGVQIATVAGEAKSEGVNPEGPKEVVLDKGYHSNEVLAKLAEWEVRSYCSEPERGRRRWEGKKEEQAAVYGNRRRIRGERGKRLRRHPNILKRLLVHVAAFNLGLVMRRLLGRGTPRGLQGWRLDLLLPLLPLLSEVWARKMASEEPDNRFEPNLGLSESSNHTFLAIAK